MSNHKEICNTIKHLKHHEYYQIMSSLTGQLMISFEHTSYKSTYDMKLSPTNFYKPQDYDYFRIFYIDGNYHVYHIEIKDIIALLNINNDKQFVCLPIYYVNCHIRKSHIGSIVFDTVNLEIIILEPNGRHPLEFVNKLLSMITYEINRYIPYKFIPLNEWLPSKCMLNYWYDGELGAGICATGNLFLIYKLLEFNNKIELNNYLANLSNNDIINELKTFIDKKIDI